MRLALARIVAASLGLSRPFLTCCVARAFASAAACDLSGIGYLRLPGSPKELAGRELRRAAFSLAIISFRSHRAGSRAVFARDQTSRYDALGIVFRNAPRLSGQTSRALPGWAARRRDTD